MREHLTACQTTSTMAIPGLNAGSGRNIGSWVNGVGWISLKTFVAKSSGELDLHVFIGLTLFKC